MHSGYDSKLIDRKFVKVVKRKRSKTIANKEQKQMKERKFNFVTDFDPEFPKIMESCLPTLPEDPNCKAIFPKKKHSEPHIEEVMPIGKNLLASKIDNKDIKKELQWVMI